MTGHMDTLDDLNRHVPLKDKLVTAHKVIQKSLPFIARIAIAIYDPETRVLKTFVHSSGDDNPLENYQALIDDAPSLKQILAKGQPRVINNLLTFENSSREHNRRLGRAGYAASYTMPIFNSGDFLGFIFFNSYAPDVFDEQVLSQLDIFGHLVSLMVINELSNIHTLAAALKTSGKITHLRDPETGSHLDRMSRYSRLIASALADKYRLEDAYIEHVFMFSPLHDIGKIGIPDEILHNFGLDSVDYVNILRNIAEYHHEAVNGTGYPSGKKGSEIPLEARIVAVADIFDALTSKRVYKEAWTNEAALETLKRLAGEKLDQDCVNALLENIEEIEAVQQLFKQDVYG
ncbi:MAG: HD domain-containing protein [Gammaproteobacteria bacterium]|jgi:HD-GYP domain-containing protein (c-di-GMP phosphodiesterase class II)